MLKLLNRYIIKHILAATVISIVVFSALLILMGFLGELKNIGTGDYGLKEALWYILLCLPNRLYEFSPLIILLGCIIGLSQLMTHNELLIMRAYGYSMRKIIFCIMSAAIISIFILSLVGEGAGRTLSYRAEVHKENMQNAGQAVVTATGVWFHINNHFIHVKRVIGKHLLEGVTRYTFNTNHQLVSALFAKSLNEEHNTWLMHDVKETKFHANGSSSASYVELPWEIKLNPNLFTVGLVEPTQMSLTKLVSFSRYLIKNKLQSKEYEFNFWQRVFQPLSCLVMILVAIPFLLRNSQGNFLGRRMLIGILIGFGFFILNAMLSQLSIVYQLPVVLSALLPMMLFAAVGVFMAFKFR